jgi:hypothetical protein
MAGMDAKGKPQEITWEAVVIRKDGTREDLGEIAYWNKSPLKRLAHKLRKGNNKQEEN